MVVGVNYGEDPFTRDRFCIQGKIIKTGGPIGPLIVSSPDWAGRIGDD